jgi:hypothetical protein
MRAFDVLVRLLVLAFGSLIAADAIAQPVPGNTFYTSFVRSIVDLETTFDVVLRVGTSTSKITGTLPMLWKIDPNTRAEFDIDVESGRIEDAHLRFSRPISITPADQKGATPLQVTAIHLLQDGNVRLDLATKTARQLPFNDIPWTSGLRAHLVWDRDLLRFLSGQILRGFASEPLWTELSRLSSNGRAAATAELARGAKLTATTQRGSFEFTLARATAVKVADLSVNTRSNQARGRFTADAMDASAGTLAIGSLHLLLANTGFATVDAMFDTASDRPSRLTAAQLTARAAPMAAIPLAGDPLILSGDSQFALSNVSLFVGAKEAKLQAGGGQLRLTTVTGTLKVAEEFELRNIRGNLSIALSSGEWSDTAAPKIVGEISELITGSQRGTLIVAPGSALQLSQLVVAGASLRINTLQSRAVVGSFQLSGNVAGGHVKLSNGVGIEFGDTGELEQTSVLVPAQGSLTGGIRIAAETQRVTFVRAPQVSVTNGHVSLFTRLGPVLDASGLKISGTQKGSYQSVDELIAEDLSTTAADRFKPRRDVVFQGIGTAADHDVNLYSDGTIAAATLAADQVLQGFPVRQGTGVEFHSSGRLKTSTLSQTFELNKILFRDGTAFQLYPSGRLEWAKLAYNQRINNIECPRGATIRFYEDGAISSLVSNTDLTIEGVRLAANTVISFFKSGRLAGGVVAEAITVLGKRYAAKNLIQFQQLSDGILAIQTSDRWLAGTDNCVYMDVGPVAQQLPSDAEFERGSTDRFTLPTSGLPLTTNDVTRLRVHKKAAFCITMPADSDAANVANFFASGDWHVDSIWLEIGGLEAIRFPIDGWLSVGWHTWEQADLRSSANKSEALARSLRLLPNEPLNGIDKTVAFFTTPFKNAGYSGWLRTAFSEGCVTGKVMYSAASSDGFQTIDVAVESISTEGTSTVISAELLYGTRYLRIEHDFAHAFGIGGDPVPLNLGTQINACGEIWWDTDREGWYEIHSNRRTLRIVQ